MAVNLPWPPAPPPTFLITLVSRCFDASWLCAYPFIYSGVLLG